jgi:hypothetical protein
MMRAPETGKPVDRNFVDAGGDPATSGEVSVSP